MRIQVSEEGRRRVLASRNWAGLGANAPWKPPRPAPLVLTLLQKSMKRPRVRSPSPAYVPFSPPPPGGFLRGSSIELEGAATAGKDDEIVDYESSESEDVVVLVPEKQRPPRELDVGSTAAPSDFRHSAFTSPSLTQADRSLQTTNDPRWESRSPGLQQKSSLKWSGRKGSTSLAVTGMFRTSPPSTSPTQLAHPADIDIRYAQDVSRLRRLSLEDRRPSPPLPSGADKPSSFDELDFSPPSALLAEYAGVLPEGGPSKSPSPHTERDQVDLESDPAQPAQANAPLSPRQQTTELDQPDAKDYTSELAEDVQLASASANSRDDLIVKMLIEAPAGWPESGPELPPLAYLPRNYEDTSDMAVAADDALKPPYAIAAEKGITLVSEQMGLGCLSLSPEEADRLVMREFALRQSGVPPLEWEWVDDDVDDELAHDSIDDWDENDEGWDSDELEMFTYGVVVPPPRLDPGQLFGDEDETGILEP